MSARARSSTARHSVRWATRWPRRTQTAQASARPASRRCGCTAARRRPDLACTSRFAPGIAHAVDRFHAAGLEAGGRDNGPPGLRADYSPTYYAAFLIDPDGNNVEAVCLR